MLLKKKGHLFIEYFLKGGGGGKINWENKNWKNIREEHREAEKEVVKEGKQVWEEMRLLGQYVSVCETGRWGSRGVGRRAYIFRKGCLLVVFFPWWVVVMMYFSYVWKVGAHICVHLREFWFHHRLVQDKLNNVLQMTFLCDIDVLHLMNNPVKIFRRQFIEQRSKLPNYILGEGNGSKTKEASFVRSQNNKWVQKEKYILTLNLHKWAHFQMEQQTHFFITRHPSLLRGPPCITGRFEWLIIFNDMVQNTRSLLNIINSL